MVQKLMRHGIYIASDLMKVHYNDRTNHRLFHEGDILGRTLQNGEKKINNMVHRIQRWSRSEMKVVNLNRIIIYRGDPRKRN